MNISSENLSDDEMNLLNKRPKFAIRPKKTPIDDVIVDIETTLKFKQHSIKYEIREETKKCIKQANKYQQNTIDYEPIIKRLNERDCFVMKADKGNKVVVMDKKDYKQRTSKLITDYGYKELKKSPLNKMITAANDVRKEISNCFGERFKWRLIVSNPEVPKLYSLPKIHKPGEKSRHIVPVLNAPCKKIARWLVSEYKNLPKMQSCSVKNSSEFAKHIKNIELNDDEVMISFDVESLFPSIPITHALSAIREHLESTQKIPTEKIDVYMKSTAMCKLFPIRRPLL